MERRWTPVCAAPKARCMRLQHHHPVRPRSRSADRIPIPALAGVFCGAPSPDPQGPAHLGRPGGRNRRSARSAPFRTLAGYGAEAINPYLAFDTIDDMLPNWPPEVAALRSRQALHQGRRQGHPQGDVEDGHLHLPVLLRRADFRRGRPVESISSTSTSPAPPRRSRASGWPKSPPKPWPVTSSPSPCDPVCRNALDVGGEYAFRCAAKPCLDARRRGRPAARGARQHAGEVPRVRRQVNEQSTNS
jgi:hypothetical protein